MPASIKHLTDKKLNLTSLLARWKDGLYYTAAIIECDRANKRCLVCFEDGSEIWVSNRDVHVQLSLDQINEDEDIVCCICDDGDSMAPNEIIICDVCQQGYHQKCHNPPVDSSKIDESEETSDHKDWFCATCSYILNQSDRAKLSATVQGQATSRSISKQPDHSSDQTRKQQIVQIQPTAANESPSTLRSSMRASPTGQSSKSATNDTMVHNEPVKRQQMSPKLQKSPIVPTKTNPVCAQAKQTPYYPLSHQVRVAANSTAALASMTASSAMTVGSSAGRSKQDLVNQSNNRTSQRQLVGNNPATEQAATSASGPVNPLPIKHAVRKSGVNFVMPVRQSALPTATRSVLPNHPPAAKVAHMQILGSATDPSERSTTGSSTPSQIQDQAKSSSPMDGNANVSEKGPTLAPVKPKTTLQVPVMSSKSSGPKRFAMESPATLVVTPKSHQVSNKSIVADSSTNVTSTTNSMAKSTPKVTPSIMISSDSCVITSLDNGAETIISPDSSLSLTSSTRDNGNGNKPDVAHHPIAVVSCEAQQANGKIEGTS